MISKMKSEKLQNKSIGKMRGATALLLAMVVMLLAGCAAPGFTGAQNSAPMSAGIPPQEFSEQAVAQDGDAVSGEATSALLNRRLIATATLDMIVQDTDATVASVLQLIADQGGFVSSSNFYGDASDPAQHYGSMTLRVPAENLDATLDALAAIAVRVRTRAVDRQDITDQYTDIEAQLRTLQATEEELFAMLEEVRERPDATPDDILAVHTRLMEVRGQIEQTQGRKNMYDNLVALSTINLSVAPDSSAAPVVEEGWRPGAVLRDATRALVNGIQYLGDFLIWFIVFVLPIALLLALPFVLLFFFFRWIIRRGRKNKTAAADSNVGDESTTP